jgi:hypothetical protein
MKKMKNEQQNLVLKHYNLTKESSSMYHKRWKNELQNQVLKHYDLTQKTASAQLQKHIARGVEPCCQKRLCPCAIVMCLHPQHTPILIHLKQNIQSGIKPKNKNHNLIVSSNNATTNFKFWRIHIPQKRPKAPSRNLKPYSTFQFHKPFTIALHVK